MSLCCRRIHQNTQQVTAPTTTPINSKWCSAGVRTVCIVSGGIVGAAVSVFALKTIKDTLPFEAPPSFIKCSQKDEFFLCPLKKFVEFVAMYGVLPGAVAGNIVANWILGKPHST